MSNIYKLLSQSAFAINEVAELVRSGADIESRSLHPSKRTVLEMAASKSGPEYLGVIERLVQLGANVNNAHPTSGVTALHLAAEYAPVLTVRRLCALGADANALTSDGRAPAFLVLQRRGPLAGTIEAALASLFAAGANPLAKDGKGVSLLQSTGNAQLKNLIRAAQTEEKIAVSVGDSLDITTFGEAPSASSKRSGLEPL